MREVGTAGGAAVAHRQAGDLARLPASVALLRAEQHWWLKSSHPCRRFSHPLAAVPKRASLSEMCAVVDPSAPPPIHALQFLNSMKGQSIDQVTQQSLSEIASQLGELFNQ